MALDPYKGKIKCSQCGYPLLGLPPVHVCPECGLEYDPYSRLVPLGRPRGLTSRALLAGLLLAFGLPIVVIGGWPYLPLLFVLPVLLCSGWLHRPRDAADRLRIDRFGIRFERSEEDTLFISWSIFGSARVPWPTGRIQIRDRAGRRIEGSYQVRSFFLAQSCVQLMNTLAKTYAEVQLTPDTHGQTSTDDQFQK